MKRLLGRISMGRKAGVNPRSICERRFQTRRRDVRELIGAGVTCLVWRKKENNSTHKSTGCGVVVNSEPCPRFSVSLMNIRARRRCWLIELNLALFYRYCALMPFESALEGQNISL